MTGFSDFQRIPSDPCRYFPVSPVSAAWVAVEIFAYFLSGVVGSVLSQMVTWV